MVNAYFDSNVFVNGNQLAGNLYQSDPITSGEFYSFQITDSGLCGNDEIILENLYICECKSDAGELVGDDLSSCEDEMVSVIVLNEAILDSD